MSYIDLILVNTPQTSTMKTLPNIVNRKQPLTIVTKLSILDAWGSWLGLCDCLLKNIHVNQFVPNAPFPYPLKT